MKRPPTNYARISDASAREEYFFFDDTDEVEARAAVRYLNARRLERGVRVAIWRRPPRVADHHFCGLPIIGVSTGASVKRNEAA